VNWIFDPLIAGTYRTLMVDPPWAYETYSDKGKGRSADKHYRCMDLDAIKALPVRFLGQADCWLWLWATAPMYDAARECVDVWGFQYVTQGVWVKTTRCREYVAMGTGYVLRNSHEPYIIARCGRPKIASKAVRSVISAPRREHSRKPDEAYWTAEKLFGDGPRVDLFSRQSRPGWDAWGLEAGLFDEGVAA
jgi:N6-adenosine-specific RNA methylase IME4